MDVVELKIVKKQFEVLAKNIPILKDKLFKIVKRGEKLGTTIFYNILQDPIFKKESITDNSGDIKDVVNKYFLVEVSGEEPKLPGGKFIATLEPIEDENIINKFPGIEEEIPEIYRKGRKCDHCNIERYRIKTYLVKSTETNEYKQVGSTCIKDFLGGWGNPVALAEGFSLLTDAFNFCLKAGGEDDLFYRSGYSQPDYFETLAVVAKAIVFIKQYGYANSSSVYSTAARIRDSYDLQKKEAISKEDFDNAKEEAEKCLTWIREKYSNILWDGIEDFTYNMYTIAKQEFISMKMFGYMAYLPIMMKKEIERVKEKEQDSNSNYVGTVGERITLKLTINNYFTIDGSYGITYIYKMKDESGNVFTWFSSNLIMKEDGTEPEYPVIAEVTGRIKAHSEYREIKQTILTRCKIKGL